MAALRFDHYVPQKYYAPIPADVERRLVAPGYLCWQQLIMSITKTIILWQQWCTGWTQSENQIRPILYLWELEDFTVWRREW